MPIAPLKPLHSIVSLQTMSNNDMDDYMSFIIASDFAATVGVGSLGVNSLANGTSIGTWVDTYRTGALGDYPVDNTAITTTSTTVYQNISNGALTGSPVRPLGWIQTFYRSI